MTSEDENAPLDITSEVRRVMQAAAPEVRALVAKVFEVEKRYSHLHTPGASLTKDLEKAVREAGLERRSQA
jgi:hypothetical protein